ncbi:MAG: hypothetical protein OXI22_00745 [Defluviicoccus sp.]|nr:hypothetical protein [Defluviicoccus sp.]MDE0382385.1 hypothetical protein [Defluviicoccus sp.]
MIARSTLSGMRRFARGDDGAAGIELGFGSAALLTISMLCFDLYSVVSLDTAGARSAVALAEFVSLETEPKSGDLAALGEFLYRQEFEAPVSVAYVISALQRPTGEDEPTAVLWTDDTIRFGDDDVTTALALECAERGQKGWRAVLLAPPATSGVAEGEVILVAEVCARPAQRGLISNLLLVGDSYHVYVLPARDQDAAPARPVAPPEEST